MIGFGNDPMVKNSEKNICVSKIYLLLNKQIKIGGLQAHFWEIKYYATLPFHHFYNGSKWDLCNHNFSVSKRDGQSLWLLTMF